MGDIGKRKGPFTSKYYCNVDMAYVLDAQGNIFIHIPGGEGEVEEIARRLNSDAEAKLKEAVGLLRSVRDWMQGEQIDLFLREYDKQQDLPNFEDVRGIFTKLDENGGG